MYQPSQLVVSMGEEPRPMKKPARKLLFPTLEQRFSGPFLERKDVLATVYKLIPNQLSLLDEEDNDR